MTPENIETLTHLLSEEETLVRKELKGVAFKDPATGGLQPKPAKYQGNIRQDDIARESTITETNTALEKELEHRLGQILIAQEKLKNGSYGTCDKCGDAIPLDRLLVVPMAPFCIKHSE